MAINYTIIVRMSWATTHDFDLYGRCYDGGSTCYYYPHNSVSYLGFTLNLNVDSHRSCEATPDVPEEMTITGTDIGSFKLWFNRFSSCNPATPPTPDFDISVVNSGDNPIKVSLDGYSLCELEGGQSSGWIVVNTLDQAPADTQADYTGGNILNVEETAFSSSSMSSSSFSSISSESSRSSKSSSSTSSESTGFLADQYTAFNFSLFNVNGCYQRMGTWANGYPVYSNGKYQLKRGGDYFQHWYLEDLENLAIHYVSAIDTDPTNNFQEYTPFLFWLGQGGTIVEGCFELSSQSSISSYISSSSISSDSSISLYHSELSNSSGSSVSYSSKSSSSNSSSSSFYKNLPVDLVSYVSTCKGNNSVTNPATGKSVGMIIEGCLDEDNIPDDGSMIDKGGLTITTANRGQIYCLDASKLFSASTGMVSVTLRLKQPVTDGIYEPLSGKENSASPDMTIFVVNPGEFYFSPPGIYAAFTPFGIEFSVWSLGNKIKIVDTTTNIAPNVDVQFMFAWDYARRMTNNGNRISAAILVDQVMTVTSSAPIVRGEFDNLFQYTQDSIIGDSSTDDATLATAPFYLGNTPSGKNGLVDVIIRRFEIYREPCLIPTETTHSIVELDKYPSSHGDSEISFSVTAIRNTIVFVDDPVFRPSISTLVNLLDVGTGLSYATFGNDLGQMEDSTYPETPNGLPIGIEEVRGRQND